MKNFPLWCMCINTVYFHICSKQLYVPTVLVFMSNEIEGFFVVVVCFFVCFFVVFVCLFVCLFFVLFLNVSWMEGCLVLSCLVLYFVCLYANFFFYYYYYFEILVVLNILQIKFVCLIYLEPTNRSKYRVIKMGEYIITK